METNNLKETKQKIKRIVVDEFSKLTRQIEADFPANYRLKVNNFLLNQMDEVTVANMVFVSSFESKSGNAIEKCAKRIARLTFGDDNVPDIVNPRGLKHRLYYSSGEGQLVVTDVDTDSSALAAEITAFRAGNIAQGRGNGRVESGVTHASCRSTLLPLSKKYRSSSIHTKPVDLAFFDGKDWNIIEIKAGGNLDSSNAPANVEKLLKIFVCMGVDNCKAYFATLYNKDGEGNTWSAGVKKHLNYPSMFLIGSAFWEKILPKGVSFEDFTHLYRDALAEIDLNKHINDMIKRCVRN